MELYRVELYDYCKIFMYTEEGTEQLVVICTHISTSVNVVSTCMRIVVYWIDSWLHYWTNSACDSNSDGWN